jgi:HSP20 family protein
MYGSICNPARDMQWLHAAMNDLFSGVSGTVHGYPPVNVWYNGETALAKAELPGVNAESLDISVVNDTLTLKGSRAGELDSAQAETAQWLRRERPVGEFTRAVKLPFRVESEKVSAAFNNGVLTLTLPRAEADKPRKIAVLNA